MKKIKEYPNIYQSKENDNLRLTMYQSYFYSMIELTMEVTDANRPKYPLLFRISKRCEEQETTKLIAHFMKIICEEFPGNLWELIDPTTK